MSRLVTLIRVVVIFSTTLIIASCSREGSERSARNPDVLLITLDTARADRFTFQNPNSPVRTPHLDQLATEGTVFTNTIAPSPITLVSHASLLTGLNPPDHGVRNNGSYRLEDRFLTLAEVLKSEGYSTSAVVAATVLDGQFGLSQGFDWYDDEIKPTPEMMFAVGWRPGGLVVSKALDWLGQQGQEPIFLWVHLYDPHAPYEPPEPEFSRFAGSPYDGTIAFSDRLIGQLLEGFKKHRDWRNSVVVFTSDHGESLGDHGEDTHGIFVYQATAHVPLIVKGPGLPRGTRVASMASLVDLKPTLMGVLGLEQVADVSGRRLFPLNSTGDFPDTDSNWVYLESYLPFLSFGWSPLKGLLSDSWKYIEGVEPELYDLSQDPGELTDLAQLMPDVVGRFQETLADKYPGDGPLGTNESIELDEETIHELEALGYLGLENPTPSRDKAKGADPRDRVKFLKSRNLALDLFKIGRREQALEILADLRGKDRGNPYIAEKYVELLLISGRLAEADDAAKVAVVDFPGNAHFLELHGRILEARGRLSDAIALYDQALQLDASLGAVRAHRWRLMEETGNIPELKSELRQALEIDAGDGESRVLFLRLENEGRGQEAVLAALLEALEEDPDDPFLHAEVGRIYIRQDNLGSAERHFMKVLEVLPGHHDASLVAGRIANQRGNYQSAKEILEFGVLRFPDKPAMWMAFAESLLGLQDWDGASVAAGQALSIDDTRPTSWLLKGLADAEVGSLADAEEALKQARLAGASMEQLAVLDQRIRSHRASRQ